MKALWFLQTRFMLLVLLALVVPCFGFIEVIEFGLINGTDQRLDLIFQYESGRLIDLPLQAREKLLKRGLSKEKLVRIRVYARGRLLHSCDVTQLARAEGRQRWLYIGIDNCRFLTSEER